MTLPPPVARVLNTKAKQYAAVGAAVIGILVYTGKIKVWRLGRKRR